MRRIWKAARFTLKAIGVFFDSIEPYAEALDKPVAWVLTVGSVAIGVIALAVGGMSGIFFAYAWFAIGYFMCPASQMGSGYKAIACAIAVFLLTVMEN